MIPQELCQNDNSKNIKNKYSDHVNRKKMYKSRRCNPLKEFGRIDYKNTSLLLFVFQRIRNIYK